jgi:hypothetical protein
MKQLLLCLMTLVVGLVAGRLIPAAATSIPQMSPMISGDSRPSIEAIQSLASLVTTTVAVSDVQLTELRGYSGATRAALLVRGDFQLGTDLSKAALVEIDPEQRHAVLVLQTPLAGQPRVDLKRSRLVALTSEGLWDLLPGTDASAAVTDAVYRDAQQMVERVSREPSYTKQSERQAAEVIGTFFRSISWTVEVRWATTPPA